MKPTHIILVDDDPLSNNLCKLYIRHALPEMEVVDFTLPERGFNYLETIFKKQDTSVAILLLDINMPQMSGWDFLEKFNALDQKIKDRITIYILSSSVDLRDINKAAHNKYVKGYLEKPLEIETIKKIYRANFDAITVSC